MSNGYIGDATAAIVAQMERFAPGFRDRVISQTVSTTTQFAAHKPNFVGGDIHRARIFASWYSVRESRCRRTALVCRVCTSARPPRRPAPAHTVCAAPTPDKPHLETSALKGKPYNLGRETEATQWSFDQSDG